jgi:hypothetical protein
MGFQCAWRLPGFPPGWHPDKKKGSVVKRGIGLALLAVGIALTVYGINASNSVGSDFSRIFTGSPTNKTIYLLVGGIAAIIAGAVLSLGRGSSGPSGS